ncbi:MBL fold metallo-hydrolase [Paenibacillus sp. CGMCC 1.16610]|uniref:MBL fold metallo-hydrolase n=1 Tax=Paenibacillus anseongense TaxID=2682845 RepID=A0ABW9UJS6_9BACL|nr:MULTISPECIES: AVAST type 1 anti-phage system MBL fold metallo-hydrolase Avs1a [Paenibacillus]MBA2939872.1 MBL fold metallo-hydrolase [Paenibacillus sp. CGMCC 1.16610]MVQ39532.1 MBL fold metallo-hydrolase [Paenibacillus anseongense]
MKKIRVEMFPSMHGDCFLLSFGSSPKLNLLVDSGLKETYHNYLRDRINKLSKINEAIDLLVITHIDEDHIKGALELFKENGHKTESKIVTINEVWHNSYRHLQFSKNKVEEISESEKMILEGIIAMNFNSETSDNTQSKGISAFQGSTLASYLLKGGYNWNTSFEGKAINYDSRKIVYINSDVKLRLLSPDTEKLKALGKRWLIELKKKKYNFNISDEEIFDDAFEFYMKNLVQTVDVNEDSPISKNSLTIESLLEIEGGGDTSPTNGSSISFIIEYEDKKLLFLGDSHPDLIYENILKLVREENYIPYFDLIKVSHHGSQYNTNSKLLALIDSPKFLISTDGVAHHHPDASTLANIICREGTQTRHLFFNYPIKNTEIFNNNTLIEKYNFSMHIPMHSETIIIEI